MAGPTVRSARRDRPGDGDAGTPPPRSARPDGRGGGRAAAGRIRVLQVVQNLNYGGMERLIGQIVRRLDDEAFEPHVMVLQYAGRFARGLERHAGLHLAGDLPPWSLLWPRSLARQIREIAPHVVHTHSGVWCKAARAARMAGIPRVVHTEHGRTPPDPWTDRVLDHLGSRRTDVTVAVSEALGRQLAEELWVREERIEVVRNGVDTDEFRPRPPERRARVREGLGLASDVPVLGSVGRLEPVKGHELMLRAFHRLVAGWPGDAPLPELVLVGDGSLREELEEEAADGPGRGRVHFLGWRNDVPALHAAFDLYTLSSRSEGTSVSLLEAMSSGLCPVVTDVGGNAAVLGDGLAHRLVPPGDPGALAAGWRRALADAASRRADARGARSRVEARFSLEAMLRAYEGIYRRDLPAGGAAAGSQEIRDGKDRARDGGEGDAAAA